MAKAPYFPLMVRNWLCSRKVLAMSGDAVKAYMFLLCEAWLQEPRATLPDDDKELQSLSHYCGNEWVRVWVEVSKCFKIGTCNEHKGRLYNELQLELSRKYESNQRFNNKNANRTRIERDKSPIEREVNAPLVIANATANANSSSNDINTNSINSIISDLSDKFSIKDKKNDKTYTIDGQEIHLSFIQKVLKACKGDYHEMSKVFYRAHTNNAQCIEAWIEKGISGDKMYAFARCKDEYDNKPAVKEWTERMFP